MNTPLPAYIDPEAWDGFVTMRKEMAKKKVPFTPRAAAMVLKTLQELKDAGHDPNASLDQSTLNGWRDVYQPKQKIIDRVAKSAADETRKMLDSRPAATKPPPDLQMRLRRVA